jgi:sugar lactone lactonase YvrE
MLRNSAWSRWSRRTLLGCFTIAFVATTFAQNAVGTFAGTAGTAGFVNGTGTAAQFRFTNPSGAAIDSAGNLFVADAVNNVIRKITPLGVVSTFAGSTNGTAGSVDGTGTAASFSSPQGIAIDGAGNLYVADTGNHAIRVITPAGVVTTLAGTAGGVTVTSGYANGTGTAALFKSPLGIAADRAGSGGAAVNVYVADTQNNAIRQVVVSSKVVTTLAGSATGLSGNTNGTNTSALFFHPDAIASNSAGTTLYVADTSNNLIRQIAISGSTATVTTLAGSGSAGYIESFGTSAAFNLPVGVAIDGSGNILVADALNYVIRSITSGGSTSLLAGAPNNAGNTNGLATSAAKFNIPSGLAVDAAGAIYVVDTNNQLVRKIAPAAAPSISVQPAATVTALATTSAVFNVTASGNPPVSYQWQRQPAAGGSFSDLTNNSTYSGVTTSQLTVSGVTTAMNSDKFQVIVSNGFGSAATSTTSTLAVQLAPTITSVTTASFIAGQSGQTFTVTATGLPAPSFTAGTGFPTWASLDSTTGVISGTPTDATGSPFTFTITASNGVGTAATQSFTLTVLTAPAISTQPANTSVTLGQNASLSVTASSSTTATYKWQRSTNSGASWSDLTDTSPYSGSATATLTVFGTTLAMSGDQFRVIITNTAGSTTSNAAILTVTQAPAITSVSNATFTANQFGTFTITTTGSPTPALSYTGTFPTWASFNTATGVISGTPTDATGSPFTFTIIADNGVGSPVTQNFVLTVQTGPVITTQPSSSSISVGQNTVFGVAVSSSTPASYRWQRSTNSGASWNDLSDSAPFSGTQSSILAINGATLSMSGDQYRVVVTNSVGSTNSNVAILTVTDAPVITSVTNATFVVNQPGSFTVTTTGSPTPTIGYSGAFPSWASFETSTGIISGTPTDTTGSPFNFTITATNSSGAVSQNFVLTVSATPLAPTVTTPPQNQTVLIGQNVTFTVVATGFAPLSYQWQRFRTGDADYTALSDTGVYSGTHTATLTITSATSDMSGDLYRVVVTNSIDSVTSASALLTVNLGQVFTTLAGTAAVTGSTDGAGTNARFSSATNVAVDALGTLYVADTGNHVIRKISPSGIVTTLAGLAGASGSVDGFASLARFNSPSGIAVDGAGTVYVADSGNHIIRTITPSGLVSTLAGTPQLVGSGDGIGNAAQFAYPTGIAVDAFGRLYVADSLNHAVRKIIVSGGTGNVSTISSSFGQINGIAVDSAFNIYVSDTTNQLIRKISSGSVVSTLAGAGSSGSTDGNGTAAKFNRPQGIALDSSNNVYVADSFNNTIRKITPAGDVTTIGGLAGSAGSSDGPGTFARFNLPYGIAVDSGGIIYVADSGNSTIRRTGNQSAPQITTPPANATLAIGGNASFTVVATGLPAPAYQWQRQAVGTTGFVDLANDSTYSGVTTATLTVSGVTVAMTGDQFRVIANNLVVPAAVSSAATLTVQAVQIAPVITTQPASSTVTIGNGAVFGVVATGTPAPTYQWQRQLAGSPVFIDLSNDATYSGATTATLTIGAVTAAMNGDQFRAVVSNGVSPAATSLAATLAVPPPAPVGPTISTSPASVTVDRGGNVTLTVAAIGSGTLSYQWKKDGAAINGATGSTLVIPAVQATNAGVYTVVVTNSVGSAVSTPAAVGVNTAPVILVQPTAQTVLNGGSATFSVTATGTSNMTYQWRKNGAAISTATNPTLTLPNVGTADAANYDVVVKNTLGDATSSIAQLTVVAAPAAPVITAQPADRTTTAGATVTLSVAATGAPAPTYQWRKNGTNIASANNAALTFSNVQPGDSGTYSVVLTNSAGTVTSAGAALRVNARSYAGFYFGSFGGSAGNFALYIRDDNTGVFLGYLPGGSTVLTSLAITVNDAGQFSFTQSGSAAAAVDDRTADRSAEAVASTNVTGTIGTDGTLSGSLAGGVTATLTATRAADVGTSQGVAGFYQAGASANGGYALTIANPIGQAFVVAQSGSTVDGGMGSVNSGGAVTVTTSRGAFTEVINTNTGAISVGATGAISGVFNGATDAVLASQRLADISTRARVTSGDSVSIAGFVITGTQSKPVLIRAVGPTLTNYGISTGFLAAPKLELYSGGNIVATNTGFTNASNSAAIVAAAQQAGAFPLISGAADSAIFTTLAPGAYTAIVSSANGGAGVALVEVYDLSAPAAGQKLFNISTRAAAGSADNTLIAGVVVTGSAPKRVLMRAVGPGLAQYGVGSPLATPTLTLQSGGQTIATNTGWSNSADAAAITTASAQSGAFPLVTGDSAMIVTLAPGSYTAQVTGSGSGIALVEVYELP